MSTHTEQENGRLDEQLSAVLSERRQLINLAYRFLGSIADAEDVVQETYARWYAMTPHRQEAITSPGSWLTTVASRICLDLLSSARAKRERYVGQWIPEPLPDRTEWTSGPPADPADRVTLDETVSMAFLIVLESMTPAERVTFVLHDVFHYSFPEVAAIVGRSPAACRKLASSARRRIPTQQTPTATTAQHTDMIRNFKHAWQTQDIQALITLLDPNATTITDGGGIINAHTHPIKGRHEIARFFMNAAANTTGWTITETKVNGQSGLVLQHQNTTVSVLAFDISDNRITHIWAVLNPDKLRHWTN